MKKITARQEKVLRLIGQYCDERGFPPTLREIMSELQIASLRGATGHLDALHRKGYIQRGNTPRAIQVLPKGREIIYSQAVISAQTGRSLVRQAVDALEAAETAHAAFLRREISLERFRLLVEEAARKRSAFLDRVRASTRRNTRRTAAQKPEVPAA